MPGVYAAVGVLPDGREVPAAVSVGGRPTFDAPEARLEAFLILGDQGPRGSPIPGLPEYGWALTLRFEAFLREQIKFDSLGDLIGQMARDCERALRFVETRAMENGVTPCR
jgi:riboflavin kinase/FMN adenylyltransferase